MITVLFWLRVLPHVSHEIRAFRNEANFLLSLEYSCAADPEDQSKSARLVIDASNERGKMWVVFRIKITALHAIVFIQQHFLFQSVYNINFHKNHPQNQQFFFKYVRKKFYIEKLPKV